MYKLLVLLAFIGCALGAALPEGMVRQPSGRVVGGQPTTISSFPYVVSIQRDGAHYCVGVIYLNNVVITAAHCLQVVKPNELKIRSGSTNWNSGGNLSRVLAFYNHEDYNPSTLENDIALIRLYEGVTFSMNVRSIPLATYVPPANAYALVSGWGSTYYNGPFQSELLFAEVRIVASTLCNSNNYGYGTQVKDHMLCALGDGIDSCQGDSGGPLVYSNSLVGIVSWGIGCGNRNYPGVYTSIAEYRNWVTSSVNKV